MKDKLRIGVIGAAIIKSYTTGEKVTVDYDI